MLDANTTDIVALEEQLAFSKSALAQSEAAHTSTINSLTERLAAAHAEDLATLRSDLAASSAFASKTAKALDGSKVTVAELTKQVNEAEAAAAKVAELEEAAAIAEAAAASDDSAE